MQNFPGGDGGASNWKAFDVNSTLDDLDRRLTTFFEFTDKVGGTIQASQYDSSNWYTWDKNSRVTKVQQYTPTSTGGLYDSKNHRTVNLQWFKHDELQKVTRFEGTTSTALVSTVTLANGGWVPGQTGKIAVTGLNGLGAQNSTWTYDAASRVDVATTPAGTKDYGYDATDQVTSVANASGTITQQQTYDGNGNRVDSGYVIGNHNRLLNDGTYSYLYDNEGNRTRRTKLSDGSYDVYSWDFHNRLTSVTGYTSGNVKTQQVKYDYDGLGRRIRRKLDSNGDGTFETQDRFVYDTNVLDPSYAEVVLVLDDTASVPADSVEHRFLNGPLLDQVFSDQTADGNILWLLQDRQQTVTEVADYSDTTGDGAADGKAALKNRLDYNAFGQITSQTNSAYQPQQTYTGQMLDSATGLLYYDARWFDPHTNQFLSEDPIGFNAGDANLRRYVGNSNPNATDPSGLEPGISETRQSIAALQAELRYWQSRRNTALQRARDAWRLADISGVALPSHRHWPETSQGFTCTVFQDTHGLTATQYEYWARGVRSRFEAALREAALAEEMMARIAKMLAVFSNQLQGQLYAAQQAGAAAAPAAAPHSAPFTTGWVHVYDPDGNWLATFEYDRNTPESRDLAMAIADRTRAGATAEQVGRILHNGIATGGELGIRVSLDVVDNIMSAAEFAQDPSLRNFLAMAPLIPGGFKKLDNFVVPKGADYLAPGVGAAARGQIFNHAWIKHDLYNQLRGLVGQADSNKFLAALKKGVVGPTGESGIKIFANPVGKYTHELKIGGSAQRLLGCIDENGVLIFDKFVRGGLH